MVQWSYASIIAAKIVGAVPLSEDRYSSTRLQRDEPAPTF